MNRAAALFLLLVSSCAGPAPSPEVDRFLDAGLPAAQRLEALLALREADPGTRHAVYPRVREALGAQLGRLDGLSMSLTTTDERMAAASALWLAEEKDGLARLKMELHLDRESVKRQRLPDGVLAALALGLGNYPGGESARETLWDAFRDPSETPVVRSAAMKALQSHHPGDLEEKILELPTPSGDDWLRELQGRLKKP